MSIRGTVGWCNVSVYTVQYAGSYIRSCGSVTRRAEAYDESGTCCCQLSPNLTLHIATNTSRAAEKGTARWVPSTNSTHQTQRKMERNRGNKHHTVMPSSPTANNSDQRLVLEALSICSREADEQGTDVDSEKPSFVVKTRWEEVSH